MTRIATDITCWSPPKATGNATAASPAAGPA
jgi:hypothetical protein